MPYLVLVEASSNEDWKKNETVLQQRTSIHVYPSLGKMRRVAVETYERPHIHNTHASERNRYAQRSYLPLSLTDVCAVWTMNCFYKDWNGSHRPRNVVQVTSVAEQHAKPTTNSKRMSAAITGVVCV